MSQSFTMVAARVLVGCCVLIAAVVVRPSAQAPQASPTYTAEQAAAGRAAYQQSCASCHGQNLDDGQFAGPLKGDAFRQQWGGRGVDALHTFMSAQMPPASPGSLGDAGYAQVIAYLLQQNGVSPGTQALPADPAALRAMVFPAAPAGPGGGVTAGVVLPRAPARANPLDRITPVTDETLIKPAEGDWLNWRRTYDAHGFSPLKQITKANVGQLRAAWTWSLPNGPNEGTPLVHDGVIFVHAYGDRVQALDAVTGDLLWQYARRLPRGTGATWKRNMSLYGDRLYVPTSDTHVVALDVKTGAVAWDVAIGDASKGFGLTGGTLVARGVVMTGTNGGGPGGNYIVGLDAKTGAERWRFYTLARPGEPGDSWNGLPLDKRNGGSVWVAGTYDPVLNIALFGPAPTYDTGPLRNPVAGQSNDALYTDATIALNPETGKLVWHYQHLKNDQWDFDWAFERTLVRLPVGGAMKTVAVTGGKQMVFDALEADGGRYLWSFDLGLQNAITAIDPKTGAKTIDPKLVPGDGDTKMVCPHAGGGRSWLPTSYDAGSKLLFIPMVESCMSLTPVATGERGGLSTGVRFSLRPRPDSDGNYGRLQAMNLETRKPAWTVRQRAPQTTGILATAGGVIFAGSFDRVFSAYDSATGKPLWKTRLNDVPNAAPVTFTAQGRQFVALTVGNGGPQAATFPNLVPEIASPSPGAALWVFELGPSAR
ncbi:MAG TPA: PQQ-binding-like beta-propeller repeat protein [Vicinamibacterales bacterium]|nr:PQQ-binding-like beta-propeller repeat protein [Vicinamibacterales bacterium]